MMGNVTLGRQNAQKLYLLLVQGSEKKMAFHRSLESEAFGTPIAPQFFYFLLMNERKGKWSQKISSPHVNSAMVTSIWAIHVQVTQMSQ
jgi:hypothetical protein